MKKTIAIGIIALQHDGGLLKRFVGEVGVLPGTTVMVPQECWCVLVAGDQATAVFDVGPHELQLMQFNRQPSGLLYQVGREPEAFTWYPRGSPYRRQMALRVGNPLQFVQEMVVRRSADTSEAVADALKPHFDAMVPPGQILAAPDPAMRAIAESLGHVGLVLVDLKEESAVAPDVPASPPPPPPPAPAASVASPVVQAQQAAQGVSQPQVTQGHVESAVVHAPTAEVVSTGLAMHVTMVWSSSTMDMFGKGELTLRVRLLGRPTPQFNPTGPFTYDQTREYLSPDEWLAERQWQKLPDDQLTFPGLPGGHYFRLYVVAEERDKNSTDPLGSLEWELGQPAPGELELGPTQGGKRGQYIKLKARFG